MSKSDLSLTGRLATCPYPFCFSEINVEEQEPDTGGEIFICPGCGLRSYPHPDGGLKTEFEFEAMLSLMS